MVNGPDHVFIERAGRIEGVHGLTLSEKSLDGRRQEYRAAAWATTSRRKSPSSTRGLPDGSRVAAVIPPCSFHGVTLTIRKFNAKHFGIEDLIRVGTITDELAAHSRNSSRKPSKHSYSGGTGTGKTTLLNILAQFIPAHQRILIIEDTAEIQIVPPNLVRFEARVAQDGISRSDHP